MPLSCSVMSKRCISARLCSDLRLKLHVLYFLYIFVVNKAAGIILTPYSITNEDGEQAIGLECANTHSLLRQKDSQANSTMIRNLSKNQLDPDLDEQEITLTVTGSRLNPGDTELVFTLEVRCGYFVKGSEK